MDDPVSISTSEDSVSYCSSDMSHSQPSASVSCSSSDDGEMHVSPEVHEAVTAETKAKRAFVPKLQLGSTSMKPDDTIEVELQDSNESRRKASTEAHDVERPGDKDPDTIQNQMAVEMLCPAFNLQTDGKISELKNSCCELLGVHSKRGVRLFRLVEIEEDETELLSADCCRVAVQLQDSTLSLASIEEVLKENQQLSELANVAGDKDETESLKREVAMLRERLSNSEFLRQRGQRALKELKEEFETLHFDLLSAHTPRY